MPSRSSKIRCVVVTPDRQVLDVLAVDVVFPAHDGLVGICRDHSPFLCKLGMGLLRYRDKQNNSVAMFISNGFGQVRDNEVTIITSEAIAESQINALQAEQELLDAEEMSKFTLKQVARRDRAIQRAKELVKLTKARVQD